jgi:hypothetical protein
MSKFSILNTGLRSMEYVRGCGRQTQGTTFQIRIDNDLFIPPEIFNPDDLKIRDYLNFGFFGLMNHDQRLRWLHNNIVKMQPYISDINCYIKFECVASDFLKLSPENINRLNSKEWLLMSEVYNMFPRAPGSKAARHSLIFRGSNWELIELKEEQCHFYFDLISCSFSSVQINHRKCNVKVINQIIGVCDDLELSTFKTNQDYDSKISWFTPGILKSLIQKCIRFYPTCVEIDSIKFDILESLQGSFLMLLNNPGSFVPDLKMFVKGAESAMKRLAVTILEDSSCEPKIITSLFFAALAARNDFKFSHQYVSLCLQWCSKALNDNYFIYDWHKINGTPLSFESEITCQLLETLGSFQSDKNMLRSICENGWDVISNKVERPDTMQIYHCFDQHCITDVINFYNREDLRLEPSAVIKIMWDESSKFNPRKHNFVINQDIKNAQRLYWNHKNKNKLEILPSEEIEEFNRNLDESWICGMIGPITHSITFMGRSIEVISFFKPDDPGTILTIRAPTRNKDEAELTDEEIRFCSEKISHLKSAIFHLKDDSIHVDHDFWFTNSEFHMRNEHYQCRWKDFCNEKIQKKLLLPITLNSFDDVINIITNYSSEGICKNWKDIINFHLDRSPTEVLFRLSMYIRVVSSKIYINQISRDGSGTYLSVNWTDSFVFKLLCIFCAVLPGVIKMNDDKSIQCYFIIKDLFIWNHVKDIIYSKVSNTNLYDWNIPYMDNRQPKLYQTEAIDTVMDRIKHGKRGNIMWLPVGSGKTFISTNIINNLMKRQMLSKYVVYTLPPSAINSVIEEFRKAGLPYIELDATMEGKRAGRHLLQPFYVNFIKHDHLKHDGMKEQLTSLALDIFLIIDEFHLMMDTGTLRTSIGLELAKTCNNFVAMTGTLVKDKDPEGLIQWLSQVVEFEVTNKNYLVGISTLISRKINYNIEERRHFIEIPMDVPEYLECVDEKLGGRAERVNFRKAIDICYDVTKIAILNETLRALNFERIVFVVALNSVTQNWLKDNIESKGYKCFCISGNNSIILTPDMETDIRVVITTMRHCTGYTLTICKTMIQGVYFSNQANRTQIVGRIVRMGQLSPFVDIVTLHTGLLSYTLKNYEEARSLEKALNDLSKEI